MNFSLHHSLGLSLLHFGIHLNHMLENHWERNVWMCWSSGNNKNRRCQVNWTWVICVVRGRARWSGGDQTALFLFHHRLECKQTHTHTHTTPSFLSNAHTCISSFCLGFTPNKWLAWWLLAISLGHASYVCVCLGRGPVLAVCTLIALRVCLRASRMLLAVPGCGGMGKGLICKGSSLLFHICSHMPNSLR